ncbi:uncharacterized protein DFL_001551 [Arthrobotrys flagrans]|uniref:Uncharacterized protein n=1 Tax=Arthrobotrys flagrans TaxID=97331 RepID=A0A437A8Q3_ARTFL|nr:hypothetical protein DFL_001551 [Arthrobotrys flagrans]
MPNVPFNRRITGNANNESAPGPSSANTDTRPPIPVIQDRRAFTAQEPFNGGYANAPISEIRPTRSTPRMSLFGQGDARSLESYNTLQSIPGMEVRGPEHHVQYQGYPMAPPQVIPGPPQVAQLGPPYVIPRSAMTTEFPHGLPYNPSGLDDTVPMRHAANNPPGPQFIPGPPGLPGQPHVPKQRADNSFQRLTQTLRNFQLYDQYEQAARQLQQSTVPGNPFGPNGVRRYSTPHLPTHASLGLELQRRMTSLRYAIDPTGQLIRTLVKVPVGLPEAGMGFHHTQTNAVGNQQGADFAAANAAQRGPPNPGFGIFTGTRLYNAPPQRQASQPRGTTESPPPNAFRRSGSQGEFSIYNSTDTNENDENDENFQHPH